VSTTHQPRRPTVEAVADWVEAARAWGLRPTRKVLMAHGISAQQAAGMAFWLADQARGEEHVTTNTRWRYSQALLAIGPPDGRLGSGATPPYVRRLTAA